MIADDNHTIFLCGDKEISRISGMNSSKPWNHGKLIMSP